VLVLAQVDLGAAEEEGVVRASSVGVGLVRHAEDLGVEGHGLLDGADGEDDVVERGERADRRGGGGGGGGGSGGGGGEGRRGGGRGSEETAGRAQQDGGRAAEEPASTASCGEGGEGTAHVMFPGEVMQSEEGRVHM